MRLITTATANVEEIQCWMKLEMVVWVFTFYRQRRKVLERTKKKDERIGSSTLFVHFALVSEIYGTFF